MWEAPVKNEAQAGLSVLWAGWQCPCSFCKARSHFLLPKMCKRFYEWQREWHLLWALCTGPL